MSTVTDPIADLLARIRNGAHAQKIDMFVPYSRIKAEVVRILKDEGYISAYSIDTSAAHPRIKITNKLVDRSSAKCGRHYPISLSGSRSLQEPLQQNLNQSRA